MRDDIRECFKQAGMREDGKIMLKDGRTGEYFDNPVTVGYMYYLKLHHLVDDKIHARSTGPVLARYAAAVGRQGAVRRPALRRDGSLGAGRHTALLIPLQEILTVKSDDVVGRVKDLRGDCEGTEYPQAGCSRVPSRS